MNSVQTKLRIDFLNDLTQNVRFLFSEYSGAVNKAIIQFIDEKLGDEMNRNPENFQWVQAIRSDLQTLIKVANITPSNGTAFSNDYYTIMPSHINQSGDYYDFAMLMVTIDGITKYSKPTSYNIAGPQFENSFIVPTNKRTYYNEDSTGFLIYRSNTGTFSNAQLTYIKYPNTFSLGNEVNLINPGTNVLVNLTPYTATQDSVQGGTFYSAGTAFVAAGVDLTSGQVILSSLLTPIDLPERVQEDICVRASTIMLETVAALEQSQAIDSQQSKQ